jgi:hypothetical protein
VSPTAPSPVAKAVGYSHGTKRERKSVQEVPIEKKVAVIFEFFSNSYYIIIENQ